MKLRRVSYSVKDATTGLRVAKKSDKWYGVFVDFRGVLRRVPLDENPKAAKFLAEKIDTLNSLAASSSVLPPDLSRWIESAPPTIVANLAKWGIVSSERVAAARPLSEHIADWSAELRARGNTEAHVALVASRVKSVFDEARFIIWSNVNASRVMAILGDWRKDRKEKRGISAQTFNHHLQALKQFCSWMVSDSRASESPLRHLKKIDVKVDRRHDRRALELDEARRLFDAAETGPVRLAIAGPDRAMLYEMAVVTGLRLNELRSLTRSSFHIDGADPSVTITARSAKNRREASLPLPMATVERLRPRLQTLMPTAKALGVPKGKHSVKALRADLLAARTAWIDEAGIDAAERERREQSDFMSYQNARGEYLDFHALRHTRGVWLFTHHNVTPREAVELMRVSGLGLVDRYSRSFKLTDTSIADRGPDLSRTPKVESATGTDAKG